MIFSYNKEFVGDVLLVIVSDGTDQEYQVECNGDVTCIKAKNSDQVIAWNIFNISELLGTIDGRGQLMLTKEQVEKVNGKIEKVGFSERLVLDDAPKIVVGYVKTCEKHPNSDHLSITQTQVSEEEVLQIICGAPNIKAGQKVVVAKPGAMMPDGLIIWPGVLRGEESFGMICSAKELKIDQAPEKKGILELPSDSLIGEAFPVGK